MTQFSTSIDIEASPERVWSVIIDVERWPHWTPTVTSLVLLDRAPFAVGSRARIRQPKLPTALWEVTQLDEHAREFTWVNRKPGICATARHVVEARGNGSRATLSMEFSQILGPLIARLTRSLTTQYMAIEAAGLKARSEG
jgi:hypothetical protein